MGTLPELSWGTLPEFPAFKAHVETAVDEDGDPVMGPPGDVYHMELVGRDKESAKMALKTLFSTGTPVAFEQFEGQHGKFGLRFQDLVSLHKFILALLTVSEMEAEEHPDGTPMDSGGDGPGDLASSIMYTLGYEWV
jgi:hypothetical protein